MKQITISIGLLIFLAWSCSDTEFKAGQNAPTTKKMAKTEGSPSTAETPSTTESTAVIAGDGNLTTPCIGVTKLGVAGITKATPNLAPGGDFESTNTDIVSTFAFDSLSSCVNSDSLIPGIGKYSIVTDPHRCHRAWDVLTSPSKIAIFNGSGGAKFWCKSFTVEAGKSYAFSVDERLLHPDEGAGSKNGSSPIRWTINGTNVVSPVSPIQQWRTRGALWQSQATTQLELCGLNESSNNSGNDWAIDNICLVPQ